MNYGIGKMRPCGHSHYYKYAHCEGYGNKHNDLKIVCHDYKNDLTDDGAFIYNLNNMRRMPQYAFRNAYNLYRFLAETPNLGWTSHTFTSCDNLIELNLKTESTSGDYVGANIQSFGFFPRKYTFNYPNLTGNISATCQQIVFGDGSEIKLYAPKATTINSFFEMYGAGFLDHATCTIDFYAPEAIYADRAFYNNKNMHELTYQAYANSGNPVFGGKPTTADLDDKGNAIIEKKYSVFSKLSSGKNMFLNGQLNKDYVLEFIKELPKHPLITDREEREITHPLYLGIHVDHAYDDEVAEQLKKLDNDYVTISELVGRTIKTPTEEEIKGWSLSVGYDGTPTNAELTVGNDEPIRTDWIDDIELPTRYTRCDYLESDGTQWINTDYVPKVTTSTDSEGNTKYTATTGLYVIAKQDMSEKNGHLFGIIEDSGWQFTAPKWLKFTGNASGFGWKTWNKYGDGNSSAFESKLNFTQSGTANLLTNYGKSYKNTLNANLEFNPTLSLYLFNANKDNTSPPGEGWCGRIYRAKISEGTKIVRDFVPAYDKSEGKPCMYDRLNDKAYYYEGTGADFKYLEN